MYNDLAGVASLRRVDGMVGTRGRIQRSTHLVETPLKYAGDSITVGTTDSTRFREYDDGTSYGITFDDLVVGWYVRIAGTVDGDGFTAERVIQYFEEE